MKTLYKILFLTVGILAIANGTLLPAAQLPPTSGHDGSIRIPLDNGKRQLVVFRGAYRFTGVASDEPSSAYRALTIHVEGAPELAEYFSQKHAANRYIDWMELLDAPDENHANYAYQFHGIRVLSIANEGQGFSMNLQIGPVAVMGRTKDSPMGTTIYRGERVVKQQTMFNRR